MYPQNYNLTDSLMSVAAFQANCPEVDISAYSPDTFSGILNEASQQIYDMCEVPTLLFSTITAEEGRGAIGPSGDLVIFPMVRPIQSVESIKLVKGGFSTTLTISGVQQVAGGGTAPLNFYQVPFPANKIIYPSSYLAGQGTLMIGGSQQLVSLRGAGVDAVLQYTAGWKVVGGVPVENDGSPKRDLIRACTLVVKGILSERFNQLGADSFRQGNISVSFRRGESSFYDQAQMILDRGGYHRTAPRV